MPDIEYRELQEWVRKLSPKALFLVTFIGSAVAAGIVSCIPSPSVRTIVVGIGLCLNALLIAWLSQVRTEDNEDNKATIRERTILLQQIKKLQRIKEQQQASVDTGRQSQPREQPSQPISSLEKSQPSQPVSSLEKSQPNVPGLPSRPEAGDPTSRGWGEEGAQKQWKLLKAAEKAMVRFVLQRGTATAAQLLRFRDPDGFRTTDTCVAVRQKTSFLVGDLESGLTINPRLKPFLEKILVEDKGRDAGSF
jgi:hypothetical protein